MIIIMVDTLPTFYYEKLIGYMPATFTDLVFAGERNESGLRKGKFKYAANMAPNNNRRAPVVGTRKKEGDAHAANAHTGAVNKAHVHQPVNCHARIQPHGRGAASGVVWKCI